MGMFDVNGRLMAGLSKVSDIIICNILFCAFCLPVVTAGASLAALHHCMQVLVEDEDDGRVFKDFWSAFKQNLGQGTVLWLICLAMMAFLGVYYRLVFSMEGMMGRTYRVSFFVLCLLFIFGFQYIFPLQARYRNTIRGTLKNAWLVSVAALPQTLTSICLAILAFVLTFYMNIGGFTLTVYLWLVFGFGAVAYLDTYIFAKAFALLDAKNEEE